MKFEKKQKMNQNLKPMKQNQQIDQSSPPKNVPTKSNSQRFPIRPPRSMEDIPKTKKTKETTPKKLEMLKKNIPNILTEMTIRFKKLEEMDVDAKSDHKPK